MFGPPRPAHPKAAANRRTPKRRGRCIAERRGRRVCEPARFEMLVHRSNRIEALVDALADLVAAPLADPFAPEWIAVQGRGMGRWLAMELARRLGVWANPKFPFPRKVIESAMTALLGPAAAEATVFDPQTLRWAVAEALPPLLERRGFEPIRRYLADDVRGAKRVQL